MVNFKEIEMFGFKSFADETHINFDGGITAIVGPNGCGKSNVSDAIRWVLGEQSSKAMRGKTMQDVIFAGTEKRKHLSYCEVSLVFDNTKKWFNIAYDEVVITRKLYRSGESEYQLNRKPCRLKDIRDILYDSGMGKDGYSIIGQGRIDEIILAKPEDRRAIFEEAAGIAKYKVRKIDAERRLVQVRDNLDRATDIMSEIERRVGPLKKQSEDAKKYLEYRDTLKDLEINAYIYKYEHAAQTKDEINTKLQGYKDNLNVALADMESEQAKYDKSLNEINQIDAKANVLHEQVLSKTISLEKQQSDSRLLNEQTRYIKEQVDRLQNEVNSYKMDITQRQAFVDSARAMRDEESENLKKLHADSQEVSTSYLSLLDELTRSEGEKEENQRAMIDNLSKLTDIKANLSGYIAKRDTLQENVKQDNEKLALSEKTKQDLSSNLNNLQIQVDALASSKQSKTDNVNKINLKIDNLTKDIDQCNAQIFALKSSISNDTNRKNILANLQADFEGYQYAVQRLLKDGKNNIKLQSAIKGVVGNLISVQEKFQTAIEIALGGSIQNIVTKNEDDAKVLIDYLKQSKLGRATFLPISAVKPRYLSATDKQYLSMNGCFGVASNLVKCDAEYSSVIESLLGSTVVCDNLENAVTIAKKSGYSFRIVTLEGDVLSPQGSMSGGSKKTNDSSLLGKENEIKKLATNIEEKTKELLVVQSKYNSYCATLEELKQLLTKENAELQSVNNDFYTQSTRLENLKQNIAEIEEEIFSLQSQIKVANSIISDLNTKINSIDKTELDYASTQAKAGEFNENTKTAYEELKQKRDEYQEQITISKVKIASTEEKLNTLNRDIDSYVASIEATNKLLEQAEAQLETQRKLYEEAIKIGKSKEEDAEINTIQAELNELNTKISQYDDFKQSLMQELKQVDDKKNELSGEISRLNNKIYQEETKLQKVDLEIETMQERVYEEYEMTYSDCLPYRTNAEDFDIREVSIKINEIKNHITALGYVNVNAIEEYKAESVRYEELSAQIEDLKKAEEDTVKIIKDLSAEMLTQFNTEFEKIQTNFTKVFKELFGGGNARLEILPSEDPLTAGVEIIAQPPGKVLQSITLLSGGEKTMTAIAILFAILKLKPMPFCFLDEIEAALDDANIDRYAQYLKRFSDETQFIVITHRKPTMELADSLYGVTMEEKGVSKIVSVKLADAFKVADKIKEDEQE